MSNDGPKLKWQTPVWNTPTVEEIAVPNLIFGDFERGIPAQPCMCDKCTRAIRIKELKARLIQVIQSEVLPILNEVADYNVLMEFNVLRVPGTIKYSSCQVVCTETH